MPYFFKRLISLIPLLIGITFLSFAVIHLTPGGPADVQGQFNPKMTAQAKDKLNQLYGLDKPVPAQFAAWCGRLVAFDFGRSFADGEKVTDKIGRAIPVTLLINGLSLFFIFLIGVPLGVLCAVEEGKWIDRLVTGLVFVAFAAPTFWLALLLMSYFGVTLRWLPVTGLHSLFYESLPPWQRAADLARHLVLPVLVSSLTGLAGISQFMRNALVDVLRQNYIRTARAKGLPERAVLFRHALKNALLPIVTILGLSIPGLLGGSVIFESIFSIPGMGRLFYNSVFSRDYPVIMGIVFLGAVLTLIGNFLADVAYRWVDPRIRFK